MIGERYFVFRENELPPIFNPSPHDIVVYHSIVTYTTRNEFKTCKLNKSPAAVIALTEIRNTWKDMNY